MATDLAQELAKEIRNVARKAKNEEDLKFAIQRLLDEALEKMGVKPEVQFEKRIYKSRRADVTYPDVVIEYKRPYSLDSQPVVRTAINELTDYLKGLSKEEGVLRRHVGVALDGNKILFVRAKPTEITKGYTQGQMTLEGRVITEDAALELIGPLDVDVTSVEQLLIYLRQLERRILSPETLSDDFGPKSDLGREFVTFLYTKLRESTDLKVKTLYAEWERVFGIVYGESLDKARAKVAELADLYGIKDQNIDLKELLFAIHSYFALLMKMIASEVLALQNQGLLASFARNWAVLDNEKLHQEFVFLESGGLFKKFGISNFLEGTFFSWYLEEWDDKLGSIVRNIARKLGDYETATPSIEPSQVKDLLKKLYQYLVPKQIRHDLGEYYTPDWLAEVVISEAGYDGDPSKRFLDPACGSGTFLILAIRKILQQIETFPERFDESVLEKVTQNVVGIDINPLAVLSARTNFIIAISPLRRTSYRELEIPIYQADSVMTPKSYATLLGPSYAVKTTVGEFRVHHEISNKEVIGRILDILNDVLSNRGSSEVFLDRVKREIPQEYLQQVKDDLVDLFKKIEQLQKEGRDHIWTSIIKNNFAPIYVGKFDYVVGNPPWIHWEDLSSDYRDATKELWHEYQLLPRKKGKGFLAESTADFSMLFTYVSADYYLKDSGHLAFLLTQTLFKAELRGRGFRRFDIKGQTGLKVEKVHDLTDLQPFEGAANKTSFIVLKRGEPTSYPVSYLLWTQQERIAPDMNLSEVLKKTSRKELEARPSQEDTLSAWVTVERGTLSQLSGVLGSSDYSAAVGTHTLGSNAVFWIRLLSRENNLMVFENLPEIAKKKVNKVKDVVEVESVYPLLRGNDIKGRWATSVEYAILIPHTKETAWRAIPEDIMQTVYPRTYNYLKRFQRFLQERVTYKKRRAGHPFYILFEIYANSFMPYKVVWQRMTNELKAAVVAPITNHIYTKKPIMPSDTVTFVGFENPTEAYYLCGMLNSSLVRRAVKSYSSAGRGFGAPHILEHVNIPKFDPSNKLHLKLAELAKVAHEVADNEGGLSEVEKDLDALVSKFYLTSAKKRNVI